MFERCGGASQALACAESNLAPILKFDASGKLVKSFGAGMFVSPHGIHVDRQGNIWLTDGSGQRMPRATRSSSSAPTEKS